MVRYREGDKEKVILKAAIDQFLQDGVKKTSIQSIAKKAGVAVGTVYLYFKDKDSIIEHVAYEFADQHAVFSESVHRSRGAARAKLTNYLLGFYDMWKPFGENSRGAIELAEAIYSIAPETPQIAQKALLNNIERILMEASASGLKITNPKKVSQNIVLSTAIFFPIAGTPSTDPLGFPLSRKDLEGLLQWIADMLFRQEK